MAKQRMILISVVCFSIAVVTVQTVTRARGSNRTPAPPVRPDRKSLQGMTGEEKAKAIHKWFDDSRKQRSRMGEARVRLMTREGWKQELRMGERQWKTIEPIVGRIRVLGWTAWACAAGWGGEEEQSFHWYRHSEGTPLTRAKAPHEMTEGDRLADELVELLRDENSKDEEIRKKIDSLQQVRAKARQELPKAKKELAAVLTTPRQEAIFLIMGYID